VSFLSRWQPLRDEDAHTALVFEFLRFAPTTVALDPWRTVARRWSCLRRARSRTSRRTRSFVTAKAVAGSGVPVEVASGLEQHLDRRGRNKSGKHGLGSCGHRDDRAVLRPSAWRPSSDGDAVIRSGLGIRHSGRGQVHRHSPEGNGRDRRLPERQGVQGTRIRRLELFLLASERETNRKRGLTAVA
jgi:hypothetical protein